MDDDRSGDKPDVRRLKLATIVSRCGWRKRSSPRMEYLAASLSAAGLSCQPALTDEDLGLADWVRISRALPAVPTQSAPAERDVISYIRVNHRLIPPLDGLGTDVTSEVLLPSGRRVDLLFKDPKRKRWIVAEVENKGLRNWEAPLRLLDYLKEISAKMLPAGYEVEGMIISSDADPDHAARLPSICTPFRVQWLTFRMSLQLQHAPGSVMFDAAAA